VFCAGTFKASALLRRGKGGLIYVIVTPFVHHVPIIIMTLVLDVDPKLNLHPQTLSSCGGAMELKPNIPLHHSSQYTGIQVRDRFQDALLHGGQ
jgi:hypothetical protein